MYGTLGLKSRVSISSEDGESISTPCDLCLEENMDPVPLTVSYVLWKTGYESTPDND